MMQRIAVVPALVVGALLLASSALWAGSPSNRQTPLVRAIQRCRPAVVNIHSQKNVAQAPAVYSSLSPTQGRLSGMGTGVILDERGYIITNHHVIEEVSSIRVTLVDGGTYTGEVIARDPETDLALLKINPLTPLPIMPLGSSDDLMHGETVIAIGNAFGYEHTVTQGIISELHRDVRLSEKQAYRDLIQTDASINPGNSGGPLINADGEMIGLNVAIRAGAQGIGFAIPAGEVQRVAAKMLSIRGLNKTAHGIHCRYDDTVSDGRLLVTRIDTQSPADNAGIVPGDRLLRVDDYTMNYLFDLERALLDKAAGETARVVLLRGHQELVVTMSIAAATQDQSLPAELVWRKMGVRLSESAGNSDVRKIADQLNGGLLILEVAHAGPAKRAGLQAGDILVGMHQWEMLSINDVHFVLTSPELKNEGPIRFWIVRNGQLQRGWIVPDATAGI